VSDNPDEQFEVLQTARERLARGGPVRLKYTLPPVVFLALSLVRLIKDRDSEGESSSPGATPKAVSFEPWSTP
jgi:vacuolar protein sorting-associated protein 35